MNPAWIVLALPVYAAQQMIGLWRWNRLLRAQHIEVDPRKLAESIWVSALMVAAGSGSHQQPEGAQRFL